MLLCVDIGNSSIDFGVFSENGALAMKSKMSAERVKSTDEYAVMLNGILSLNHIGIECITDCIISSVVPPLTAAVMTAIRTLTHVTPIQVGPGIKTGLNIKIDSQTQLGTDLVANAVAAQNYRSADTAAAIIVDIGTATTFTVLGSTGILEGVIICPGLRVSLDALSAYASALPDVSLAPPKRLIARNSCDAMNAGALFGHAFMIDGFLDKIAEETGAESCTVFATGGLADLVLPYCRHTMEHKPDLTLEGLRLIWAKNRK